jgi:hypothetical protein
MKDGKCHCEGDAFSPETIFYTVRKLFRRKEQERSPQ